MKNKLLDVIIPIADYLARKGVYVKGDVILTAAIKTQSGYRNMMWRAVYDFYNYKLDEFAFISTMIDLIAGQLRRAYNEGLRSVGIEPRDMTGEMKAELAVIITSEEDYVLDFAQAILDNRDKDPRPPSTIFKPRIDVWANRYQDVVNRAALTGGEVANVLLKWKRGATETGCATCTALDGIVATAKQWADSEYRPQRPPNDHLECGGWLCDCDCLPTDDDATIPADGKISV